MRVRTINVAPFGRALTLAARINGVAAELNRLESERVELRWPGLEAAFVSGDQRVEEIAAAFNLSTAKVYRIARQCGWGKRPRRQSALSCLMVGEKLRARAAAHAEMRRGEHG